MLDTKLGALQKALAGENENGDLERQRDWPKHIQMAEPTPTITTDLQPAGKLNRLLWTMGDIPGEKKSSPTERTLVQTAAASLV